MPVYCDPPLGTQVFGGSPPRYLSGTLGQTISSLNGLQGKQGENLFLLITIFESQPQAAPHQGLADTEVEGVVEWLDLDKEAECLLVQDVAHSNFFLDILYWSFHNMKIYVYPRSGKRRMTSLTWSSY